MKKLISSIIFLILASQSCFAQSGWFPQSSGTTSNLASIFFLNSNTGWIGGDNIVIKTTNGGTNWIKKWDTASGAMLVSFINENTGWILASNGRIKMYKTTNGGDNWSFIYERYLTIALLYVTSMSFLNEDTGCMTGYSSQNIPLPPYYYDNSIYYRTMNGGFSWDFHSVSGFTQLYDVQFVNSNTGWIAGNGNFIAKSVDGGNYWFALSAPYTGFTYFHISFVNDSLGWLLAKSYSTSGVARTVDGGYNWQPQYVFNSQLTDLFFFDDNHGWCSGYQGKVFATSDGGLNWYFQPTPSAQNLNSIYFCNTNTGWTIGNNGTILKTTIGVQPNGVSILSNQMPGDFSLSQNYPNPFNPSTKIKFDIPPFTKGGDAPMVRGGFVKLLIYDILGREVSTLVNEQLKPGTYEVDWDGSNYSSGVYFYSLQTEQFNETKKMVLLK